MAQKFEYSVWTATWGHGESTKKIEKELNARGGKGWELVGMTRDESPGDVHEEEVVLFVFKRATKK